MRMNTSRAQGLKHLWMTSLICLVLGLGITGMGSPALAASSSWDAALKSVELLYDSFEAVELSNKVIKQEITQLRKLNNNRLSRLNASIKGIDKSKVDQLQASYDKTKQQHAPLLAEYTELGKQAAAARKAKNTKSALMYDLKRNRIKEEAAAARLDIKKKYDALSAAKKQKAAKDKVVKDALIPVSAVKKLITAENKSIADMNKRKSAADKRYKSAVKTGNAITAAAELNLLLTELKKMNASHQKILGWEKEIQRLIAAAENKLTR
ncbi:hypothetical protein [Paenibacillus lemnae]|uniref:Colicin import membrane protein n=1 Tax=Paenibacillus lemnae TaxID=1330551 RepID=A0A848M6N1_PAELE|nr:hypothetical protein [Paenibacillus lemnae]NMO95840.1 hypothetical protein [Paenibacillus lemnae]